MAKMPAAGEHHCRACLFDSRDHLIVAHRSARLDYDRRTLLQRKCWPVGKGKEGVGREYRTGEIVAELTCLRQRDLHRIDATLLARADPDRLQIFREDDRVRADVLAHTPREQRV